MRYATFAAPGGPEVLIIADGPVPAPRAGEVLIRVHTAGLNGADLHQRAGHYPPPPDASPILGLEVSGEITAIGSDVGSWRVGDAVCALTPGGGYAEYVTVPAGQCLPIPQGLTLQQAAAIPEVAFTVWINVFEIGRLQAGETFLVHGGSSGIGTFAIQLAKARGARVMATAGTARKCEVCRALGADIAINHREQDFVVEVSAATDGRGADVILDMVGGDYTARNVRTLAVEGRLVQISTIRGNAAEIHWSEIMRRRATLTGSHLRPRTAEAKARVAAVLRESVWPLLDSGRIVPVIDTVFPFAQVAEAHRYLEAGDHIGKVLLAVGAGR
jgi:putative PIG3 family NAD(P)H quinone oxidoreductase